MSKESKTLFFTGSGADIKQFDKSHIGKNFEKDEEGFFFTTNTFHQVVGANVYEDPYSAGAYAKNAALVIDGNPVIYPVYLTMNNPLKLDKVIYAYYLNEEDPFDGCHQQDFFDEHREEILEMVKRYNCDSICWEWGNETFAVVFEPEQIQFALS